MTARAFASDAGGPNVRTMTARDFQDRVAEALRAFTAWREATGAPLPPAVLIEMRDTGWPRTAPSSVHEREALIARLASRCGDTALSEAEKKKLGDALAVFTVHARQYGFSFLDVVPFIAIRTDAKGRITHTSAGVK